MKHQLCRWRVWTAAIISLIAGGRAITTGLIPTADGTRWNYQMTQESAPTDIDLQAKNAKEHFDVSYHVAGTQQIDNLEFVKLEMDQGDVRTSTDFIREEESGIVCGARMDKNGALIRYSPPQTMVATPLKTGAAWKFNGEIGQSNVVQQYQVSGEEDVQVPAGKFRAWRIHCDQTEPTKATIERWFVPGTGFVKIRTEIRGESGGLLQQTSLELKELPKVVVAASNTKTEQSAEKLTVGVSNGPKGDLQTVFNVAAPAIYAQWSGHGLPEKANIRAVFIAENVAGVTADYQIDDTEAVAPSTNSRGVFTLAQPDGGWTPGDYRIEFSINDEPAGTVKMKITK